MITSTLAETARKAAAGTAISEAEARQLMATSDIVSVGMISSEARRVRVGDRVTFVRVAEISVELAAAAAASAPLPWPAATSEIRITGTPRSINAAIAAVRAVVLSRAGASDTKTIPITAFSLADLWSLANGDGATLRNWRRNCARRAWRRLPMCRSISFRTSRWPARPSRSCRMSACSRRWRAGRTRRRMRWRA